MHLLTFNNNKHMQLFHGKLKV